MNFLSLLADLFKSETAAPSSDMKMSDGGQSVDFHNNFGTAPDFDVPASSHDAFSSSSPYSSFD